MNAREPAAMDPNQTNSAPTTQPESWVDDMHEHFSAHGYYRALDLQRVLGDPGEPVVAHVNVGFGNNYPIKR